MNKTFCEFNISHCVNVALKHIWFFVSDNLDSYKCMFVFVITLLMLYPLKYCSIRYLMLATSRQREECLKPYVTI